MTPFDFLIVIVLLALSVGGLAVWSHTRMRDMRRETVRLSQQVEQLQANLDAMISAASGSDKRVAMVEKRLKDMIHKQEVLEENNQAARPYDKAIHLVRQGATAQRLVEELGLSPSEADLLIMLHGETPENAE